MDRKQFLASMLSLGGAALASSASAALLDKAAEAAIVKAKTNAKRNKRKIDPATAVLLSDIHICGELEGGKSKHYPYNPTCLKLRIAEILSMRPLPANVLVFGDVAWDYGLEEDYRYAAELLSELEQVGIRVTLGMGNHDRRTPFFNVFPQYVSSTKVADRVVSVVEMPHFNFVMLDSLAELPNLRPRQATTVTGNISGGQIEWLQEFVKNSTRRVVLGAHHPLGEMANLEQFIAQTPTVAGYVYGHTHIWDKSARVIRPRKGLHMVQTVGLPATFYGDIGFVVMRSTPQTVMFEYTSKGFWWPQPMEPPPAEWLVRAEDLTEERCRFLL